MVEHLDWVSQGDEQMTDAIFSVFITELQKALLTEVLSEGFPDREWLRRQRTDGSAILPEPYFKGQGTPWHYAYATPPWLRDPPPNGEPIED